MKYFERRLHQTGLLLRKNFILQKRNIWSTLGEILTPFFFILLLWGINYGLTEDQRGQEAYKNVLHQPITPIRPIPRCVIGSGQSSCITLALVNHGKTERGQTIFQDILARHNIPKSETIEFDTEAQMDDYIAKTENHTQGGYIFDFSCQPVNDSTCTYKYGVQYNTTGIVSRGIVLETENMIGTPMRLAAQLAITRNFSGDDNLQIDVSKIEYPHPEIVDFDLISTQGTLFFFGALCFSFVIQLGAIVSEKERGLREYLTLSGMKSSVFWLSWFITNVLVNIISVFVLISAGAAFQMDFFLINEFSTYFVLFLLFSIGMVALSFVCSLVIGKSKNALLLGSALFLFGTILQGFASLAFAEDADPVYSWLLRWFPFVLLALGMSEIGSKSVTGFKWTDVSDPNAFWTLETTFMWLGIDIIVFLFITWYVDAILEGGRVPWFPFTAQYWCDDQRVTKVQNDVELTSRASLQRRNTATSLGVEAIDQAVRDEHVKAHDVVDDKCLVLIRDLVKKFGKEKAVDGLSLCIEKGMCFCLLGVNGAGKTTTLKILTGLLSMTSGMIEMAGHSIPHELDQIRSILGVCPQHDVLWPELTGAEHIAIIAALKNADVDKEVADRLADVELSDWANNVVSSYSGGMRRRLSVAISLTANPDIVILDECTTGMDPVSRRQVWTLIEQVKREKLVILTSHSMEEADTLGDRIAVMTKGKLTTIGTALELKMKYGHGYRVSIEIDKTRKDDASKYLATTMPSESVELPDLSDATHLQYSVPTELASSLANVFDELKLNGSQYGIGIVTCSNATLEDVFLNICKIGSE